ncbi:MAG: glycosyltransferase family 39 protein [Actinobacteria bacterium]|nr:MAG: glycosyltransferase family 39 protein [Actinomycetota bacterium]
MEGAPATTSTVRERRRSLWQSLLATYRYELGAAALWLALAGVLAGLTSRVQDWYVMTDELLYERLAISIAHLGSPLPHVHGELIGNVNQLYPLLLAPLFHGTLVPPGLHHAHVLNAFVMSSAAVPAYLLTRRVTQSVRLSYVVAALTICIPWIAISSFLMTEVVAYPVFVWAALALHHALVAPRPRHDALLLFALVVAILARTQFAVFLLAVPFALLIHEFAFAPQSSLRPRLAATARGVVSVHRVLAVAYACLLLAALGLLAAGRLSSALGTYSVTAEGNLFPSGMAHSLVEHLAPIGLGMGILPFVVGIAWLGTAVVRSRTREQHAFAALAVVVILALLLEVTSYDLRFGQGRLHDRYLFYVVPLVLVAFAAALRDRSWSRWPVFASAGLLALALAYLPVVRYDKFNVDSPVAFLNGPLLNVGGSVNGARLFLAFVTIAAGGLLLLASVLLGRRRTAVILLAIAALAMPVEAGLAFNRLFTADGTSGRPLTVDQSVVFDWIDRELGAGAKVTMLPYPFLYGTYWGNTAYWWNVEFWNESIQRAAVYEGAFTGTPDTFPTIALNFDSKTGRSNVSPSDYVAQAVAETRFGLVGQVLANDRGLELVRTEKPWRAEWLALDLYRDGWTVPKMDGRIRVFATPDQTSPTMRFLTISVRGPAGEPPRDFQLVSNASDWRAKAGQQPASKQLAVCVPPHGYADLRVSAPHFSPIYGDPRSDRSFSSYARSGGVLVTGIALADETSPC